MTGRELQPFYIICIAPEDRKILNAVFLNEQKNPRSGSRFGDCCVLENIPSSQTDGASLLS